MSTFYTTAQVDEQAGLIGQRIRTIKTESKAYTDSVALTAEERAKLGGLESSKFLGTFLTSEAIPTEGAVAGNYADVDAGVGSTVERWIFDVDSVAFVKAKGEIAGETSASVKTKYESNPNTNVFTDAEKTKLEGLTQVVAPVIEEAMDISGFTFALDTAINTVKSDASFFTILESTSDYSVGAYGEYQVNNEGWKTITIAPEALLTAEDSFSKFLNSIVQETPENFNLVVWGEDAPVPKTIANTPLFLYGGSSYIYMEPVAPEIEGNEIPTAFIYRTRTGEITGMSPDYEYATSVEKSKITEVSFRPSTGVGIDIVQDLLGGAITLKSTAKVYPAGE